MNGVRRIRSPLQSRALGRLGTLPYQVELVAMYLLRRGSGARTR